MASFIANYLLNKIKIYAIVKILNELTFLFQLKVFKFQNHFQLVNAPVLKISECLFNSSADEWEFAG